MVTNRLAGEHLEMALRQRWAAQIEHTVTKPHEHGTVWGDAKPDKLVVDLDDNIWLVDVGGGLPRDGSSRPCFIQKRETSNCMHALAKMKEGLR
jgi:tRNA A-37 threonylcarbamoyl transferase component Bud32